MLIARSIVLQLRASTTNSYAFSREREGNEEENEKQKRNDFNASPRSRPSRRNREADRGGWERKNILQYQFTE